MRRGCREKGGAVRAGRDPVRMGARFIGVDRGQVFLMPPSVRDWVAEGHLVWTVLDAVGERRGRQPGAGYSTIAEFRCRHEQALGEVFSGVLGLCAQVGLALVGVVSIDGTKMSANASMNANRDYTQIARAILREAGEIDQREDELYGDARGDELPEHLRTRHGRQRALREAKERLQRERDQTTQADADNDDRVDIELDPQQFVTRPQGRRAWLREARRALE